MSNPVTLNKEGVMPYEFCSHDRVAKDCPYCLLMKRRSVGLASSALPETDDDFEDEFMLPHSKHTRGGRASLDEWEADDSSSDGLADLFQRGIRRNPRDTGEQDILSENEQNSLGELAG